MSGRSARTIRNFSFEFSPDLVLHGIRKSTFQHSTVNTSSKNGLKTFLMDPVLENKKNFYFRYLHIPLSISKTEKMKTRISVSHIKSMHFLKIAKTNKHKQNARVSASQLKSMIFRKLSKTKKTVSAKIPYLMCSFILHKSGYLFYAFSRFFLYGPLHQTSLHQTSLTLTI